MQRQPPRSSRRPAEPRSSPPADHLFHKRIAAPMSPGWVAALCAQPALVAGTAEVSSRGFFAPVPCGSAVPNSAKTPMLLKLPPLPAPQHRRKGRQASACHGVALCRQPALTVPGGGPPRDVRQTCPTSLRLPVRCRRRHRPDRSVAVFCGAPSDRSPAVSRQATCFASLQPRSVRDADARHRRA